jgi:hypothetical protein
MSDYHAILARKIKDDQLFREGELLFYILNGGYEKVLCMRLAHQLTQELFPSSKLMAMIEEGDRTDILVRSASEDPDKGSAPRHRVEVKHSYLANYWGRSSNIHFETTGGPPKVCGLHRDMKKLLREGMERDQVTGTQIYLLSEIKSLGSFRSGKPRYIKVLRDTEKELQNFKDLLHVLGLECATTTGYHCLEATGDGRTTPSDVHGRLHVFMWTRQDLERALELLVSEQVPQPTSDHLWQRAAQSPWTPPGSTGAAHKRR